MRNFDRSIGRSYNDGPGRYMVFKEGGGAPSKVHKSRIQATLEAERLCNKHPGETFMVVKIKEIMCKAVEKPATVEPEIPVSIGEEMPKHMAAGWPVMVNMPYDPEWNGKLGRIAFQSANSPECYYVDLALESSLVLFHIENLEPTDEQLPEYSQKVGVGSIVKTKMGIGEVREFVGGVVGYEVLIKLRSNKKVVQENISRLVVIEGEPVS